ncbi:MAG: CRISPR-associated endonuclease Cas1, partial [Thiotrichaceae bacterium]|nr:CRISPR-associated endonuclease Cas1 [Thiotrichaceae bacterium]
LLGKLAEHNITTVILSSRRSKQVAVISSIKHNDASIRIKQYQFFLSETRRLYAIKRLIRAKLIRQLRFIKQLEKSHPKDRKLFFSSAQVIRALIKKTTQTDNKESLMGIEGAAAKQYFQCYTKVFKKSWNFSNRNKRPPEDPVNSVLSFTYTLLHSRCTQALNSVGLDPMIGFMHELDYGRDSLSSDIMEPLRPYMDDFVWRLFKHNIFLPGHFDYFNKGGKEACYLNKKGRRVFYPEFEIMIKAKQKLLNQMARSMVNYLKEQP